MHGITRCPQCHTAFNVAQQHLAKAEGKVRCGRCKHTFIATQHWVSAEIDDADLAFERPDISFKATPKLRYQTLTASFILLLGIVIAFFQWHQQPPSRMTIERYVAQLQSAQANTVTITGIITNDAALPQAAPDMLLSIHLNNGESHSARIPSHLIHFNTATLYPAQPTSFSFTIERPRNNIDAFTLSPCCRQKN